MLIDFFLVRFFFNFSYFPFVPCGGLSWLHVSFLLHVKIYTISYRIVSYCVANQRSLKNDHYTYALSLYGAYVHSNSDVVIVGILLSV